MVDGTVDAVDAVDAVNVANRMHDTRRSNGGGGMLARRCWGSWKGLGGIEGGITRIKIG